MQHQARIRTIQAVFYPKTASSTSRKDLEMNKLGQKRLRRRVRRIRFWWEKQRSRWSKTLLVCQVKVHKEGMLLGYRGILKSHWEKNRLVRQECVFCFWVFREWYNNWHEVYLMINNWWWLSSVIARGWTILNIICYELLLTSIQMYLDILFYFIYYFILLYLKFNVYNCPVF